MSTGSDRAAERQSNRRLEKAAGIDDSLGVILGHMQDINWAAVPTMSTQEAAAFTARLSEARDALREEGLDG